jgi:biotin carboxyl carrier protein
VPQTIHISVGSDEWQVDVDGARTTIAGTDIAFEIRDDGDGRFSINGTTGTMQAIGALAGGSVWIGIDGAAIEMHIERGAEAARSVSRDQDALTPPMAATVVRIEAPPGTAVHAGDTLVVLEAMKMELAIRAPRDGVVRAIHCREGQLVQPGLLLVELER